jgi:hypothetical protein
VNAEDPYKFILARPHHHVACSRRPWRARGHPCTTTTSCRPTTTP